MTEPIFEIVTQNKNFSTIAAKTYPNYSTLLQSFITTSYGFYTQMFIKKISESAESDFAQVRKCNVKKILHDCVSKFMLSDLEIVFVGFFCDRCEWDYEKEPILEYLENRFDMEEEYDRKIRVFIEFISFFVKSYLSEHDTFISIQNYLQQHSPSFFLCFQKWIKLIPTQSFTVSPREINAIYSEYSRNCQSLSQKKDYNDLVDTIIELSTTYSIIPSRKVERSCEESESRVIKEKNRREREKQRQRQKEIERDKRQSAFLYGHDLRSKRESFQDDSFMPQRVSKFLSNEASLIDYRRGAQNSSAIFEGLFGNGKSSTLQKNQSRIQRRQSNPGQQKAEEPERSREKRPGNKTVLLKKNLHNKQKPNELVTGFLTNPTPPQMMEKQKTHNLRERSFLNNSNLGLFKQSNISRGSNLLPPIPFKADEEGFHSNHFRFD